MTQPNDWNTRVIEEFRANGGKVEAFPDNNLLLLHHTGAKSGQDRVTPLAYQPVDGGCAIFASKAGAPDNPAWFYNLKSNPQATIEIGTDTVPVTARVTAPEEREPIWTRQKQDQPGFAEYEQKTSRQIPVVILEPARS